MRRAVSRQNSRGFTLVELLVALAVFAILTAIAYPMYQDQVRKARRSAVKGSMLQISQFMERQYTESMSYNSDAGGNAVNNISDVFNAASFLESPDEIQRYYNLSFAALSSGAYTIQAAPKSGQDSDKCGTLGYSSTGNRTTTSNYVCW